MKQRRGGKPVGVGLLRSWGIRFLICMYTSAAWAIHMNCDETYRALIVRGRASFKTRERMNLRLPSSFEEAWPL